MAKEYVYTRRMQESAMLYFESVNHVYDTEYCHMYVDAQKKIMNELLSKGERVFLNEALDALSYSPIPAGQCVGWDHGEVVIEADWENETITFRCEEILSRWIKEVEKK